MANKLKVILDTDLGSDCEDAGALAVLHKLEKQGKAQILAVTHCTSEIGGAVTIQAINELYGRGDIPVGRYETKTFLEEDYCKKYTAYIMSDYLKERQMPEFKNAVKLLRKTIAENKDITLIEIGPMNNITELLKSRADEFSCLSGIELVKENVKEMYVMGGHFKDTDYKEYNIVCDIESAQYVADNFPMPIVYCGFEIGCDILTGAKLKDGKDNMLKEIYNLATEDGLRPSWDPITVYYAVTNDMELFLQSEYVMVSFDKDGRTIIKNGGKDSYIIRKADKNKIRDVIDSLMAI